MLCRKTGEEGLPEDSIKMNLKGSGGQSHPFSGANINVEHKKKVDLGVLRGADHDGRASEAPFSTVLIDSEVRVLIAI